MWVCLVQAGGQSVSLLPAAVAGCAVIRWPFSLGAELTDKQPAVTLSRATNI